jgi:flagellin-like protein
MNIGKSIRKFRRNMRAISPVIATLLMIAIAVVASLVTYAWVMGYMSFTTNKTGLAIQIQSVSPGTPAIVANLTANPPVVGVPAVAAVVYVQNVGDGVVSFDANCVYVDGLAKGPTAEQTDIKAGDTVALSLTGYGFATGSHSYTIKVTSTDGTFSQINKIFPP